MLAAPALKVACNDKLLDILNHVTECEDLSIKPSILISVQTTSRMKSNSDEFVMLSKILHSLKYTFPVPDQPFVGDLLIYP